MSGVGVTGTRYGATDAQLAVLEEKLVRVFARTEGRISFHHGDCVGVDEQAAAIAQELGFFVVSHPPVNESFRAWFPSDRVLPPRGYTARNQQIVQEANRGMFALPARGPQRGGTWNTIRYARSVMRYGWIIWPNGLTTESFSTEGGAR